MICAPTPRLFYKCELAKRAENVCISHILHRAEQIHICVPQLCMVYLCVQCSKLSRKTRSPTHTMRRVQYIQALSLYASFYACECMTMLFVIIASHSLFHMPLAMYGNVRISTFYSESLRLCVRELRLCTYSNTHVSFAFLCVLYV